MAAGSKKADNITARRPASARTIGGSQVGSVKPELQKGTFFFPDVEVISALQIPIRKIVKLRSTEQGDVTIAYRELKGKD